MFRTALSEGWDFLHAESMKLYERVIFLNSSYFMFLQEVYELEKCKTLWEEIGRKMIKYNVNLEGKTVLITGAAGFIGSRLAGRLLADIEGIRVIGIDNMNDYYDVKLKQTRIHELSRRDDFVFIEGDISDKKFVMSVFSEYLPQVVVNLAAQVGVRYSVTDPDVYIRSNLVGFYNILEGCRSFPVEHLVFASSSSVYGLNDRIPFSPSDQTDRPVSLYAATKKSNELMAHAYAQLYQIPSTGIRFFTVYGPAGRPDMAYYRFTDQLLAGKKIQIFNYGHCERDFTYIDDAVTGVMHVIRKAPDTNSDGVKYKIYNIGNNRPENLLDFIDILQHELVDAGLLPEDYDFEGHRELVPMQSGDVETTCADIDDLVRDFGFRPDTELRCGLRKFVAWYKEYHTA